MAFFREVGSFPAVHALGKIFLYAVVVLLGGAMAAPLAWHLIAVLPADWLHGLIGEVQRMPFHRYLSRSIQVAAILLLWPLMRTLQIRPFEELGLYRSHRALRDFGVGLGAGIPSALLLVDTFLYSGAFDIHPNWALSALSRILLTAVVVALMEEFLFRGVILGFFRQFLGNNLAIFISAVIFAVLHFLNLPSTGVAGELPHWWSGLAAFASMRGGLPSWPVLAWAFGTLLLAGMILGWMTIRTGSLWASIALHGSWIFSQQLFNSIAGYHHTDSGSFLPFVGPSQCHGAVPVGLDALFSLIFAGVLAAVLLRNRPKPKQYY